jgi:hypothetical protein
MKGHRNLVTVICSLAVFCFVLHACIDSKKKYVIPEKELVDVLVDLHLADGMTEYTNVAGFTDYYLDSASLYTAIFNKHGVTRAEFDSTLSYYSTRTERFQKIYEKAALKIRLMEQETTKEAYPEPDTVLNKAEGKIKD